MFFFFLSYENDEEKTSEDQETLMRVLTAVSYYRNLFPQMFHNIKCN